MKQLSIFFFFPPENHSLAHNCPGLKAVNRATSRDSASQAVSRWSPGFVCFIWLKAPSFIFFKRVKTAELWRGFFLERPRTKGINWSLKQRGLMLHGQYVDVFWSNIGFTFLNKQLNHKHQKSRYLWCSHLGGTNRVLLCFRRVSLAELQLVGWYYYMSGDDSKKSWTLQLIFCSGFLEDRTYVACLIGFSFPQYIVYSTVVDSGCSCPNSNSIWTSEQCFFCFFPGVVGRWSR